MFMICENLGWTVILARFWQSRFCLKSKSNSKGQHFELNLLKYKHLGCANISQLAMENYSFFVLPAKADTDDFSILGVTIKWTGLFTKATYVVIGTLFCYDQFTYIANLLIAQHGQDADVHNCFCFSFNTFLKLQAY